MPGCGQLTMDPVVRDKCLNILTLVRTYRRSVASRLKVVTMVIIPLIALPFTFDLVTHT